MGAREFFYCGDIGACSREAGSCRFEFIESRKVGTATMLHRQLNETFKHFESNFKEAIRDRDVARGRGRGRDRDSASSPTSRKRYGKGTGIDRDRGRDRDSITSIVYNNIVL